MRRVPGKYIVIVVVLAAGLFFAALMAASKWLEPAAERFRKGGGPQPTAPRR